MLALRSMFELDSSKRTADTFIELAVPTKINLLSASGTNPPIFVEQPWVRRGLSMSKHEAWAGHDDQHWLHRTGLGEDGPTRVEEDRRET